MKKSDRFLKTAVLGVLAAFLFPALIHAALLTDDDIPVIGEETEQTAVAAEVRGFRMRTRESGYKRYPFTWLDAGAAIFGAVLITGAIMIH